MDITTMFIMLNVVGFSLVATHLLFIKPYINNVNSYTEEEWDLIY